MFDSLFNLIQYFYNSLFLLLSFLFKTLLIIIIIIIIIYIRLSYYKKPCEDPLIRPEKFNKFPRILVPKRYLSSFLI